MDVAHPDSSNHDHQTDEEDDKKGLLPPTDRGKHAYLFLAACFVLEALIWGVWTLMTWTILINADNPGFPFAFGIFEDFYSSHEPFRGSNDIAVIGTCSMGVSYVLMPLNFGVLLVYPRLRRWATPVGLLTMCLALLLSSLATTALHLILSQGVVYGIGAGMAYCPTMIFMDDWFVHRKGMAFGTMWAGTGLSGVILPIVMQWLLNSYGFRIALRIWTIVVFVLATPMLYFVKPRVPISPVTSVRPFSLNFLGDRPFVIYQVGNTIEGLGFFLPTIFLPTYARQLGATDSTASLTVILVNLASVFGCIAMGTLTDRYHATTCILVSTVGSTLAVFFLWGFSRGLAPLYVFCVAYGVFAGSFTSTWPAVTSEVRKQNPLADTGIVMGFLSAGRGVGNVVSGPLSDALIRGSSWRNLYGCGEYGLLVVFTGATAFLGGLSVPARLGRWV